MSEQSASTSCEGQDLDRKSLRTVTGSSADFAALARDCVCFANGAGGRILIGIEDGHVHPPSQQRVDVQVLERVHQRIGELTVNVQAYARLQRSDTGGEYIVLTIPRGSGVASTSDGRYFLRVGDTCLPVLGDDVLRLADERPARPWEAMATLGVPRAAAEASSAGRWTSAIRQSDRAKRSVTEKSDDELLDHYGLAKADLLANLGVLLVGTTADRASLGTAPIVQAIKYDERGAKVQKYAWDDHRLSPAQLIDAIWQDVPDFRESYEMPAGFVRTSIPTFDEAVVRELLVNAFVHRPYTQRGDIFLNLHPDRLEVVNPGRLPLGVTPRNILHASRRRNDALARVFHDLQLMEREGSGFDLLYERLLASGRPAPTTFEGIDSVHVVILRRVVQPGIIRLLAEAHQRYQLTQRERIALALLAQTMGLSAREFAERLELDAPAALGSWIGRLLERGLIEQAGRTMTRRYVVPAHLLREGGLGRPAPLGRVSSDRLRALILEDLAQFPGSARTEVHRRIGPAIHAKAMMRALSSLVSDGVVIATGDRRWRTYRLAPVHGQKT